MTVGQLRLCHLGIRKEGPAVQASQEPSGGELGRGRKVRMQERLALEKETLGTASSILPIRKEKKGQVQRE